MTRILLAGASGMVGRELLQQALTDPRVDEVVAPARRALAAHAKLRNPLVDFDDLPVDADWWKVDAVICTLGTTIRDAGSQAAFRKVDYDYPLAVARHALAHGASTFVLTSASGANADSRIFYSRTKGELEDSLRALGFRSLGLVRPGLLGGQRERRRPLEHAGMQLLGAMGPLLPRRYRVVPAERVAATLLRAALHAEPGVRIIESE
ncbi:MAG: NAD(P)H-binding protein, partial [Pseudoxanthomonas sp.]